jgi:hypothetical protein
MDSKDQTPAQPQEEPTLRKPVLRSEPETDDAGTPPTGKTGRHGELRPDDIGHLPT